MRKEETEKMTYIIADIHGRADRFHSILKQIHFSEEDTLYILGDVIDRNPDGIQILLEIMDAANMPMLLGNHEYMMLNVVDAPVGYPEEYWAAELENWYYNGGEITLQAFLKQPEQSRKRIIDYLENLPLNREISINGRDYLLVHGSPEATFEPGISEYPDVTMYAVWNRLDPFAENDFADKTILCGHTPTIFFRDSLPMEILINGNVICMDCGCAFPDGRLGCLCLETEEIFYSEDPGNAGKQYRVKAPGRKRKREI